MTWTASRARCGPEQLNSRNVRPGIRAPPPDVRSMRKTARMIIRPKVSAHTDEVELTADEQIRAALAALQREPVPAALVIDALRADWAAAEQSAEAVVARSA